MALPKDIFDLFQENRDQVQEQPGPRVWERLEQRLDQDERQPAPVRHLRLSPLRIAAAVAVVVVAVFLLNRLTQTDEMQMAEKTAADTEPGFQFVGDISTRPETTIEGQAVEQQQRLRAVHMNEGKRSNHLLVGNLNQSPSNPTPSIQAPVNITPPKETTMIADAEESAPKPQENAGTGASAKDAGTEARTEIATTDVDAAAMDAEGAARSADIPTYNSSKRKIEYYGDELDPEVAKFQWILGQWKNTAPYTPSYEEWSTSDPFTIQGKGYILSNGVKTFTEQMQIKKIGAELYFISALDASGQPIEFKLKTLTPNQAVFENTAQDFPQQVILNQLGTDQFSTIYQNQLPTDVPQQQETYFSNRNAVGNGQVSRNMSRVGN
ncbi:MAG: hypothetical protein KDC44_14280 [Phaeodactylibacter sp.]|nr:hypothetical protein [Phaeodactylibacter sp.]